MKSLAVIEVAGNATPGCKPLRDFADQHIDKDYTAQRFTGFHENELFFNCTFKDVRGVTFKDCDLNHSRFLAERPEEVLGVTVTLGDCNTFDNVEFSPFLFDLYLVMLLKSKGNDAKRKALVSLIGKDRVIEILRKFKELER